MAVDEIDKDALEGEGAGAGGGDGGYWESAVWQERDQLHKSGRL